MIKSAKYVRPYLGCDQTLLEARIASRCPGCSPAGGSNGREGGGTGSTCDPGPDFNVPLLNNPQLAGGNMGDGAGNSLIIYDGLVWVTTDYVVEPTGGYTGDTYLRGYDQDTGALVKSYDIKTLSSAGQQMTNTTAITVDSNGYFWLSLGDTLTTPGEYGAIVINPADGSKVAELFPYPVGYGTKNMRADNARGLIWLQNSSGYWISIDDSTHTPTGVTIPIGPLGFNYLVALDTDKNEMWGFPASNANPVLVYDASNGTLLHTLASAWGEGAGRAWYHSLKGKVIYNNQNSTELWSTTTYAEVARLEFAPGYSPVYSLERYLVDTNEYLGDGYSDTVEDFIVFVDADAFTVNEEKNYTDFHAGDPSSVNYHAVRECALYTVYFMFGGSNSARLVKYHRGT